MHWHRQFSLSYVMGEVALIAVACAAGRIAMYAPADWVETQTVCICIAVTASCGAIGGTCLRMAMGLVAGGVFATASIPFLCLIVRSL